VLLFPGVAKPDLGARGWIGSSAPGLPILPGPVPPALTDLVLLVLWSAAFLAAARLRWRWTARG
jgi:hypothetical protein